jgi:hypothetical protein
MNARILAAAIALGVFALPAISQAAENPLTPFAGNWSGAGKITTSSGDSERIRCRGQYKSSSGGGLTLSLRCASDSYKFELASDINYDAGKISGSWNETSRSVFGSLEGRASPGHIQATAQSVGFSATLAISLRGNSQSVSIRSPGSEISEVAVSLARGGR